MHSASDTVATTPNPAAASAPVRSFLVQILWRIGIGGILALPAHAQEKPEHFASHWPIDIQEAAPYYRISIPLAVYLASAHGDLRDLRVFNAAGQTVPHARLAPSGDTEERIQRQGLPWFPLPASTSSAAPNDDPLLSIRVKQAPDGTLVEIKNQRGPADTPSSHPPASEALLRGYVLDASQITDRPAVRALQLDWDKAGGDFQLLDIETSDDLQHWRPLAREVQLARLDYNGARIEQRSVPLPGFHDRYLRLIWRDPAHAPQLTRAEIEQSSSRYRAAPLAWSAPIGASAADPDLKPGEYRFRLAQALPLAALRIELPPGNQLLPVEVLTARPDRRRWTHLAGTVAYRIASRGREWSNTEIPLPGTPLQEFVLRLDPRLSASQQGPRLAFAIRPDQLVFLASGTGPYTLAIGKRNAMDAALSPATLVPGFGQADSPEIVGASIAAPHGAPSPTASSPDPNLAVGPERNWKKIVLWSVLLLGVLGMAAMAWQLLRQMKRPRE